MRTHNRRGIAAEPPVLVGCLLLLSGDCGSQSGSDASASTDPITVVVTGPDQVEVEVTLRLTSNEPVTVASNLYLIDVLTTPTPQMEVIITLECPDSGDNSRNLAFASVFDLGVGQDITAPADVTCTILITPAAALETPIEVQWTTSALIMWGYEDRNTDVGVAIEVVPL